MSNTKRIILLTFCRLSSPEWSQVVDKSIELGLGWWLRGVHSPTKWVKFISLSITLFSIISSRRIKYLAMSSLVVLSSLVLTIVRLAIPKVLSTNCRPDDFRWIDLNKISSEFNYKKGRGL